MSAPWPPSPNGHNGAGDAETPLAPEPPPPKTSRLAQASLILALVSLLGAVMLGVGFVVERDAPQQTRPGLLLAVAYCLYLAFVPSLACGAMSMDGIERRPGTLGGREMAALGVRVSLTMIVLLGALAILPVLALPTCFP